MQIPDYYEFLNHSKIISGKCSMEGVAAELGSYDAQKPLVIARKNVVGRGLAKKFIKAFYDSGITLGGVFDDVTDYAGITLARNAAFLYRERGCDSIIALGNGPAVDLAKAVNVLVSEKTDSLSAHLDGAPVSGPLKPLILVAACRTNGREAANVMVVDNRKITSDFLYPDVIVIDPRMTPGCCPDCIAESAVIALTHAFTALTDKDLNPMTAATAHPAMSFLSEHLLKGIKRPKNKDASLALANASVMASCAYANARPGMTDLLAEELSSSTGISAGTFMGVLLPAVVGLMQKKRARISDDLFLSLAGIDAYAVTPAADRAQKGLEEVMKLMGVLKKIMPSSLRELKVQKYALDGIAQAAAAKSGKRLSDADCRAVLEQAW